MTGMYALSQVLLLPAELSFASLRKTLHAVGFHEIDTGAPMTSLIEDEPEFFTWAWPGGVPQINYSFNPVARLRLLDVAEAPPVLRAVLAQHLRPLAPALVHTRLQSTDDRDRLWALYAAQETERLDLIHDIGVTMEAARGALRGEAETVLRRLGDIARARLDMLTGARLIADMAMGIIDQMGTKEGVAELLVRPDECAALFVPEIADQVASALRDKSWPRRAADARPKQPEDIAVAPAGLFRGPDDIIRAFPMGYRQIAGWLTPSRVWMAWQGTPPDGGRMLMDGLVFTGTRWVFFPKPFRVVLPLLPQFPQPDTARTD